MGAAVQTPETRAIVEQIAAEYGLAISRWFGEDYSNVTYFAPIGSKTDSLVSRVNRLDTDAVNLQVVHIAPEQSDMNDMIDLNELACPIWPSTVSTSFRRCFHRNSARRWNRTGCGWSPIATWCASWGWSRCSALISTGTRRIIFYR